MADAKRLPFADQAIIPMEKLRDYLLSPSHPMGAAKAQVFVAAGYRQGHWVVLRDDLVRLVTQNEAKDLGLSDFGHKYAVSGILQGPTGKTLIVLTIWMIRHGEQFPRFVTAYPGRRR